MDLKNLLKDSKAYHEDNDSYEIFSIAEDGEGKVANYIGNKVKDKIVLDAGCGTGKFLKVIEEGASKYIGIDISSEQLNKAKDKSQKSNSLFIKSNLSNINLDNESVDLIISSWVLGTVTNIIERNKCLNELKRVLKPNGTIILIENATNSEFEALRGRDKDSRTKDYNDWILSNGFIEDDLFETFFIFNNFLEAKNCFNVIYGNDISSKINSDKIEHKIIAFKYSK